MIVFFHFKGKEWDKDVMERFSALVNNQELVLDIVKVEGIFRVLNLCFKLYDCQFPTFKKEKKEELD